MRSKVICISRVKYKFAVILMGSLLVSGIVYANIEERDVINNTTYTVVIVEEKNTINNTNYSIHDVKDYARTEIKLKEYENMPHTQNGYKVVGKLKIDKIGLETYILNETNNKSLNVSVTKICGPEINMEGNFCIAGHNYFNNKMFGKLNKVEIGDKITLTDTYNRSVIYSVYSIEKVNPKEIECLSQETSGDREITLITCTITGTKRLVVKAIEVYD